jgi:hypothetical protein
MMPEGFHEVLFNPPVDRADKESSGWKLKRGPKIAPLLIAFKVKN